MTSGETGYTVGSTHQHLALGTSQVRAMFDFMPSWGMQAQIRGNEALGAHLDHSEP